jgi:hypothetical protein
MKVFLEEVAGDFLGGRLVGWLRIWRSRNRGRFGVV